MRIHIRHDTRYTYDRPVFIEPTSVRLTPREDATQRLIRHEITFDPPPEGVSECVAHDGSTERILWFSGERAAITIHATSIVETLRANPFDYIITHAPARELPVSYPPAMRDALAAYTAGAPAHESVVAWSERYAAETGRDTAAFLMRLAEVVHGSFHVIERLDGDPFDAAATLEGREGACRDVAMLYVEACRVQGLAARFVSGYSVHNPPETTQHELHAWAEVYLPGGGWRAFDPSLGLAVADGHVALTSGPDHRLAAPVTGSYRGTGASSALAYDIHIRAEDAEGA
ncbi:MAG: transglutaminase family protein [Phycisphaerales bacterium]|nr:MAG: transglutaminase family protein [Phycisphaerales bacterium]